MESNSSITGICVSPGRAEGLLRRYEKDVQYEPHDIVLLNEWVTTNVSYLKNAGGLISSRGGITCHASIIAREYRIPGLVAAKNVDELADGTAIILDATNETVELK